MSGTTSTEKPTEVTNRSIVILSQGEYSSYEAAPYRVLKPFRLRDVMAQWKADPNPHWFRFELWLADKGYVELLDVVEINPEYDLHRLNEQLLEFEFRPS